MNRSELTEKLAEELDSGVLARTAMETLVKEITKALANGERVHITGLGSLTGKRVAPRPVRNPSTGETVISRETVRFRFLPATALHDAIVGGGES